MCRISGIITRNAELRASVSKVKSMCNALKHGGPDDEGIFSDEEGHVTFGHRRLSIIDLSQNGHQPMADDQKKIWITFNGEIYNYLEIKQQLISEGATFHSGSDTEVIIQAYIHWGTASFGKLRGIFAFGLYDTVKELTFLVRDSNGIKPLYYHIKNKQLSFASEVQALERGIGVENDPNWKIRFLAYGYIPEPYTTKKDVFNLPKGHYLCWNNRAENYEIQSYQSVVNRPRITDAREAKELVREGLTASVKRQLIADAPIGVFLSGGIDSSILTLLAHQQKATSLKTVSIYFNEKAYDEHHFQNLVSDHIEGEKLAYMVKQQDFDESLPQIMHDMDMPTTDGINTWFISRYAHMSGLKAVLSGLGADELFGGYPSFNRIEYLKQLKRIPNFVLNAAGNLMGKKYKKLSYAGHDHAVADYLFLRGYYTPPEIAEILETDLRQVEEVLFKDTLASRPSEYNKEAASWFEMNMYMQNQLLRDSDVMGMRHALEIRVPFLDEDFIDQVQAICPCVRFDDKLPKKLLIDSFIDILPREVWDRQKMGFSFPLQQWIKENSEISNPQLYKCKKAKSILKQFQNNEVHWSKIYALYQITEHEQKNTASYPANF